MLSYAHISGETFTFDLQSQNLTVTSRQGSLRGEVTYDEPTLSLRITSCEGPELLALMGIEYLFGQFLTAREMRVSGLLPESIASIPRSEDGVIERSVLLQMPQLWHHKGRYDVGPERYIETKGRLHPERPRRPDGVVYKRFVPELQKTLSLRVITLGDLETFHKWHNSPRVSFFWELNKSLEELRDYIEKGLQDPHQIPMIVEFDGVPVGYFEMYWVAEDRLGPYYDSHAFDRGFHFLIGNKAYLGYKNTDAIIKSCLHFLFLDDARTRRVMAEPRHDNQKVLKYAEASLGWKKLKEFDFPHRRAALLENSREVFFKGNPL